MKPAGINAYVIENINRGNSDAFALLYDRYFSYLCACAMVYVLDFEVAKEVVDDVFVNVWNRRGTLEFPIHHYLVRSVHNGSLNHLRAAKSRRETLEKYKIDMLDFLEEFTLSENSAIAQMEAHEMDQMIRDAVNTLPSRCREVFEKYFYEGLTPAEIAIRMNINISTVRVQIKTAMDRIKTLFGTAVPLVFFLFFRGLQ